MSSAHQITIRHFIFPLFFFFLLFSPALAEQSGVVIYISGVDGKLYDNVRASLKIYQRRNESDLTTFEIKRLHTGANEEIEKALEPFGYYSVKIEKKLEEQNGRWEATYKIDPGEPVRIDGISFTFDVDLVEQEEQADIIKAFPLHEGDILDHTLYKLGKKQLLQKFVERGYLRAEYSKSQIKVNIAKKNAQIQLTVKAGPRFKFGKTSFDQELLNEDLLRLFIPYAEGDIYSPQKLLELQRALNRTRYFGSVIVQGELDKAKNFKVPIRVVLSKADYYNRYNFGLGYATDDGIRGKIGWNNSLLNRQGHTLISELKLAEREQNIKFVYGVPTGNPQFEKILYGGTFNKEEWDDTDINLYKGGVSYEHAGTRFRYGGGLEFRDEKYNVGDTSGESFLAVPSLNWSVAFADDLVETRNGLFFSLNVKGASEDFISDSSFVQSVFSGKGIMSPFPTFRLIGRFSFGATILDDIEDLPPSLRFYAGGDQSVRGYGYKDLGPQDSSGTVVGGQYLIFGSIEAEKIITGKWSMAAFFDTGNAVNDLNEDLKEGVGIGVRYRLPFGQLRLDVASAISEEDNPLRLHLTMGGDL